MLVFSLTWVWRTDLNLFIIKSDRLTKLDLPRGIVENVEKALEGDMEYWTVKFSLYF